MLSASEWHALEDTERGHEEVYRIPGGTTDPGLGISDYLEYKQEVEAKRRAVKAEYAATSRKANTQKAVLLDRYDKLFILVTQRDERDKTRAERLKGHEDKLAKARMQEIEYKEKLLKEISELENDANKIELEHDAAHTLLADFLRDNATILTAVEKAEALDTEQRRKVLRKQAHEQILEAFQGYDQSEYDGETNAKNLTTRETASSSSSGALRDELKRLREYEEVTDDLVDRLRIKVESIDLLEESQVEMIDSQISDQKKLAKKVLDLLDQTRKNNHEIEVLTDSVRMEILDRLEDTAGNSNYQCGLLCVTVIVLVLVVGCGIYYLLVANSIISRF